MNFPLPATGVVPDSLPTDLIANTTVVAVCHIIMALNFGLGLCWFAWRSVRERDPLPLLLLASGFFAAVGLDGLINTVALLWYAGNGGPFLITAFGHQMPLWVPLGYGWYFGATPYFLYLQMKRNGVDARQLFRAFVFLAVLDTVMEIPLVMTDVYRYYGDQPFNLLGFPLWYAIPNGAAPVITACIVYLARPYLRGRWALATLLIVPIVFVLTYIGGSWSLLATLNMDVPTFVRWIAAVISVGTTIWMVWIAISVAKTYGDNGTYLTQGRSGLVAAGRRLPAGQ